MIELRNVTKRLGGKTVLQDLSLHVHRGETFVIVGPSGTGKSVTLKHIAGLLRPDQGAVLIGGEDINTAHGRALERIRSRFGMLFQSGALINWMTVRENVALPLLEKTDLGDEEIEREVGATLERVGLHGIESQMPAELSGGMRKRVGLARAIIRRPEIVLYDEPTSGLDPILARSIDGLVLDLKQDLAVTSVVVTHDLRSAFTVGDRVAMLCEGRTVAEGTPSEFRSCGHPFVQQFIDSQFGVLGDGGSVT